jgi:ABC-type cobalamin transport system permease subunit
MNEVEYAELAVVAALLYIVWQHVLLSRAERKVCEMHNLLCGIALGSVESKVVGDDITFRTIKGD